MVVTPVTSSIDDGDEKDDAPFAAVLFVTTYCSITILPSDNAALTVPSPK